nr:hypothetical protein [Tanacetum cinerariifolium]
SRLQQVCPTPKKRSWPSFKRESSEGNFPVLVGYCRDAPQMESSATREYQSLIHTFFLTHTVGGVFLNPVDKALYDEMLRLQGLGSNTPSGVPYIDNDPGYYSRGQAVEAHSRCWPRDVARVSIPFELSSATYPGRLVARDSYTQRHVSRESTDLSLGIVIQKANQRYKINREAAFSRVKTSVRSLNLKIAYPGRFPQRGGNCRIELKLGTRFEDGKGKELCF